MADVLKDVYSNGYISRLADVTASYIKGFDKRRFADSILLHANWEELTLKQRMRHIASKLYRHIDMPYELAIERLMLISAHFAEGNQGGYASLFFPDIVEQFGLNDFETSMRALECFTQSSSGEFAIRQFLIKQPERTIQQMIRWAESDIDAIRRLASEGCRPRLPWGQALKTFKNDPSPILPILEMLKQDRSLYVRRSVANNLNDIAKDNPETVIAMSRRWIGVHKDTDWILKHGNRSLLKQSHHDALALFNYPTPEHILISNVCHDASVEFGQALGFSFTLSSPIQLGRLRLEFKLYFMKANGKQQSKVFNIGDSHYPVTQRQFKKSFSFKAIATRIYYPGEHALEIMVNGQSFYKGHFSLEA